MHCQGFYATAMPEFGATALPVSGATALPSFGEACSCAGAQGEPASAADLLMRCRPVRWVGPHSSPVELEDGQGLHPQQLGCSLLCSQQGGPLQLAAPLQHVSTSCHNTLGSSSVPCEQHGQAGAEPTARTDSRATQGHCAPPATQKAFCSRDGTCSGLSAANVFAQFVPAVTS